MADIIEIRRENLLRLIGSRKKASVAEKWNTSASTLSQITSKNPNRNLGTELARKIEEKEGLPRGWLDQVHSDDRIDAARGNVTPHPAMSSSNVEGGPIPIKEGRVPVKGCAQLGPGGYFEAMDYSLEDGDGFLRIYSSDRDAFGLRVVGNSMMPRIRHHEFVVIEPNHDYVSGDEVLVCTDDGQCMIKVFIWLRDGQYRFDSINNDFDPVYLLEEDVDRIHYVGAIVKPSRHAP